MKESNGITGLSIPGENEREWWKPDRNGIWQKSSQAPSSGQPVGYAFSAFACHSYPLWISSDDPEIIDQIIPMELEQIGAITAGDLESHRDMRKVEGDGARTLIQALVIPGDLEDASGAATGRWQRFIPSACLFAFPRNRIVIWKEMGRFVVAFTREGRLVHFHAFGKGAFSEDLVAEIACIYGELYGRDVVDEVTSLLAWTEDAATPEARVIIDRLLQLQVEKSEKPPPDLSIASSIDLVPESVLNARAARKKRGQWLQAAALVTGALVIAAGLATWSLVRAERYNQQLRDRVLAEGPTAKSIRMAKDRWESLSPAITVERQPIEIFHQIATLIPPKGIQVTKFEISGNEIKLGGEASSGPIALSLESKLKSSPELSKYEWRQNSPIKSGITKFNATGIYRSDAIDEG